MFKAGACPSVALTGLPSVGRLLILPASIRLKLRPVLYIFMAVRNSNTTAGRFDLALSFTSALV